MARESPQLSKPVARFGLAVVLFVWANPVNHLLRNVNLLTRGGRHDNAVGTANNVA
jgi:hypothetical protein